MPSTKEDCAHYFATRFCIKATWRKGQYVKFPCDSRNALAAEQLLDLKSGIKISDAVWEQLSSYYNETDARRFDAVSQTNGDVGFRKHPKDFSDWVDNLLSNLARAEQVRN